nr:MAG TPA: hypothetical protein [Caudoviricetes sp.]
MPLTDSCSPSIGVPPVHFVSLYFMRPPPLLNFDFAEYCRALGRLERNRCDHLNLAALDSVSGCKIRQPGADDRLTVHGYAMEAVHQVKARCIQRGFTALIDADNRVVGTRLCAQVYQRDAAIGRDGLPQVVLGHLVLAHTAGNCSYFGNCLGVARNKGRGSIEQRKKFIHHIHKRLVIGVDGSGCGQVNSGSLVKFGVATGQSDIQTIKLLGVGGAVTVNDSVIKQCTRRFDFLFHLELYLIYDTAHPGDDAVNLKCAAENFQIDIIALLFDLARSVFFIDCAKICGWLSNQAGITVGRSCAASGRGNSVVERHIVEQEARFSKFVDDVCVQIGLDIQFCLCKRYWHNISPLFVLVHLLQDRFPEAGCVRFPSVACWRRRGPF